MMSHLQMYIIKVTINTDIYSNSTVIKQSQIHNVTLLYRYNDKLMSHSLFLYLLVSKYTFWLKFQMKRNYSYSSCKSTHILLVIPLHLRRGLHEATWTKRAYHPRKTLYNWYSYCYILESSLTVLVGQIGLWLFPSLSIISWFLWAFSHYSLHTLASFYKNKAFCARPLSYHPMGLRPPKVSLGNPPRQMS